LAGGFNAHLLRYDACIVAVALPPSLRDSS
jgi:hypothetical protein